MRAPHPTSRFVVLFVAAGLLGLLAACTSGRRDPRSSPLEPRDDGPPLGSQPLEVVPDEGPDGGAWEPVPGPDEEPVEPEPESDPGPGPLAPGATRGPTPGSPASALVAALRRAGATVAATPTAARPPVTATVSAGGGCWLGGHESRLTVDGEAVSLHHYPTAAEARQAAATVGCTGDLIGSCILEWMAHPHFYRQGRLVVMHVGSKAVAQRLTGVLGPPFAGEGSACLARLRQAALEARAQVAAGDVGAVRGIVRDQKGRRVSLLVARLTRLGWSTTARTGWAPYGKARQRGELLVEQVPSGTYRLELIRPGKPAPAWTGQVTVARGQVTSIEPRLP